MDKKKKIYIYVAVGLGLLLVGIGAWLYHQGTKKTTLQDPSSLPGSTGGGSGASNDELKVLAEELYNDMNGYNWNGHDMSFYKKALTLNDTDLIKLYNAYNSLYQKSSGQTLVEWIDNEKFWDTSITDTLLAKMSKLNLK
jgi:hypothetical protein